MKDKIFFVLFIQTGLYPNLYPNLLPQYIPPFSGNPLVGSQSIGQSQLLPQEFGTRRSVINPQTTVTSPLTTTENIVSNASPFTDSPTTSSVSTVLIPGVAEHARSASEHDLSSEKPLLYASNTAATSAAYRMPYDTYLNNRLIDPVTGLPITATSRYQSSYYYPSSRYNYYYPPSYTSR